MSKPVFSSEHRPTHEEIAQRARTIYEKSGRVPGRDVQNWLQAEAELTSSQQVAAKDVHTSVTPKQNSKAGAPKTTSTTARSYAS